MTSPQAASIDHGVSRSDGCLSGDQLLGLIEDPLSVTQHTVWIAHLDQCNGCRSRLEEIVADDQQWTAVRRNLSPSDAEVDFESARLTAAIGELQDPTRTDLAGLRSNDAPAESEPTEEILAQIGPYRIIDQVGRGGMGQVYKAYDSPLERFVAIKRITDSLVEHPDSLERFRREARSAAAVRDRHVVAVHAIESASPHPYIVMEFIEGCSLEERLRSEDRLEWQEIARIGAEVATGLAAAHAAGVIHRDIKPGNILIEQSTGYAKIGDFGLARSIEDSSLTQTGCVRGTPEYISPEQASGDHIDHRADLFSLGSVLYAACTGEPPFRAANTFAVLRRTREDQPQPIGEIRDDIPPTLIQVIDRLMSKDADDRYETAGEVAEVLQRIQQGQSFQVDPVACRSGGKSTRRTLLTLAAALLLMAGIGIGGIYAAGLLLALGDSQISPAAAKKTENRQNNTGKNNQTPSVGSPPSRVQIVTPETLMRERIQSEKDQLDFPQHPSLVREFSGHTGPVAAIAWTPDSKSLVSCSGWPTGDRTARLWNVANGKEVRKFDTAAMPQNPGESGPREAPGELSTVAVTPDGKQAVTGSTGGAVCVWDLATGKLVRQFTGHTATVYDAAISPQGDVALTGGRDTVGRLWNLSTGEELMQLTGHRNWLRAVAISPDGRRALTGSYDRVMRLWDLDRGEMIREFKPRDQWIWDIVFAPSSKAAAGVSGTQVQIWDLESGELLRVLNCVDMGNGTSVDISPDGRLAVSGGYDGQVRLWSVDTGELLETYTGHRNWVWTVKFSPDGQHIASAGGGRFSATGEREHGIDFALRLWKLPKTGPQVVKPN